MIKRINIAKCSRVKLSVQSKHFHSSQLWQYKNWSELNKKNKQHFIRGFIQLYKEKHPCSKSNVMYRALANDMEEFDDTPYVFGILYNEIRSVSIGISTDNKKGVGAMGDPDFEKLLLK